MRGGLTITHLDWRCLSGAVQFALCAGQDTALIQRANNENKRQDTCVELVESSGAIQLMVQLIRVAQEALHGAPGIVRDTPKWITPMLLFIDLYEKVVLAMKRRDAMASICSNSWKWFDVGAGKWQGYQPGNNKTINDAVWAGDPSVKFTTRRRKYNIQFGSMMQANEETGNRKPLMITLKRDRKALEAGVKGLTNFLLILFRKYMS